MNENFTEEDVKQRVREIKAKRRFDIAVMDELNKNDPIWKDRADKAKALKEEIDKALDVERLADDYVNSDGVNATINDPIIGINHAIAKLMLTIQDDLKAAFIAGSKVK